jgi:hypothetical protein
LSYVLNEKINLYIDKNVGTFHILFQIVTFMKLNQLLKNIGLTQPLHRIQYLKFAVEIPKIDKYLVVFMTPPNLIFFRTVLLAWSGKTPGQVDVLKNSHGTVLRVLLLLSLT